MQGMGTGKVWLMLIGVIAFIACSDLPTRASNAHGHIHRSIPLIYESKCSPVRFAKHIFIVDSSPNIDRTNTLSQQADIMLPNLNLFIPPCHFTGHEYSFTFKSTSMENSGLHVFDCASQSNLNFFCYSFPEILNKELASYWIVKNGNAFAANIGSQLSSGGIISAAYELPSGNPKPNGGNGEKDFRAFIKPPVPVRRLKFLLIGWWCGWWLTGLGWKHLDNQGRLLGPTLLCLSLLWWIGILQVWLMSRFSRSWKLPI